MRQLNLQGLVASEPPPPEPPPPEPQGLKLLQELAPTPDPPKEKLEALPFTPSTAAGKAAAHQVADGAVATARRVAAVVLPNLLCELALGELALTKGLQQRPTTHSFAVVVTDTVTKNGDSELEGKARLAAVSAQAHQWGVRAGQTITEARALLSQLQVVELNEQQVRQALERIAESLLKYAATVSFALSEDSVLLADPAVQQAPAAGVLGDGSKRPASKNTASKKKGQGSPLQRVMDTVWLDITGTAHLFGGEAELCEELRQAVKDLGHLCRIGVSAGPVLARAFAYWQGRGQPRIVAQEQMAVAVKSLPILALPVEDKVRSWLVRLGLLTLEDLARIPRQVASSRLGSQAKWVLQLLQGQDSKPLLPYVPLALPEEKLEWDEALSGSEPLLFVLRGLTSRVATRLQGRGLAALALEVTIFHDRAVSRLKEAPSVLGLRFELATPLYRAEELFKVLSARVSRTQLVAPSIGLELKVLSVSVAHQRQLELASARSQLSDNPESMAVLFGELAADIGRHRFGTLQLMDSHRPEKLSLLQVVALNGPSMKSGAKVAAPKAAGSPEGRTAEVSHSALELYPNAPTRLLKQPLLISAPLRKGTMISLGCQLYCVEQVQFERRLEEVEWWSRTPISRDYVRLWLKNAQSVVETLAYVDRNTGQRYIQGIYD